MPNSIRNYQKLIKNFSSTNNKNILPEKQKEKKDINHNDMRLLLKKTRKYLTEQTALSQNNISIYDQQNEEKKFIDFFNDLNITVKFEPLQVYDGKGVFWGGTIDGMLQFVYKITNNESESGIEFNYLEGFDPNAEDNKEIIKRIENYYNKFFDYWKGILEK